MASVLFTFASGAVVAAIIGAIASAGRRRAAWAGYAVACGAYLALVFGPLATASGLIAPPLLTTALLDRMIPAAPIGRVWLNVDSENLLDDQSVVRIKPVDLPPGHYLAPSGLIEPLPTGAALPPLVKDLRTTQHYHRVGHILFSIALGLAGSAFGWRLGQIPVRGDNRITAQ